MGNCSNTAGTEHSASRAALHNDLQRVHMEINRDEKPSRAVLHNETRMERECDVEKAEKQIAVSVVVFMDGAMEEFEAQVSITAHVALLKREIFFCGLFFGKYFLMQMLTAVFIARLPEQSIMTRAESSRITLRRARHEGQQELHAMAQSKMGVSSSNGGQQVMPVMTAEVAKGEIRHNSTRNMLHLKRISLELQSPFAHFLGFLGE